MTLEELQKRFSTATEDTWHQHPNGGGWVQNTAYVAGSAYVGPDALVYDSARVYGSAQVYGSSLVCGLARVYGGRVSRPLTVVSDKYTINPCAPGTLRIGCEKLPVGEWLGRGREIAAKHDELEWYETFVVPILPWLVERVEQAFDPEPENIDSRFITTVGRILMIKPESIDWRTLTKDIGISSREKQVSLLTILEANGIWAMVEALRTCDCHRDSREFFCYMAESVLPLYERVYPSDKRPRKAIETSRKFARGEATPEELQSAWLEASKAETEISTGKFSARRAAEAAIACASHCPEVMDYSAFNAATDATQDDEVAEAAAEQWWRARFANEPEPPLFKVRVKR
jgi:hypothetical protein